MSPQSKFDVAQNYFELGKKFFESAYKIKNIWDDSEQYFQIQLDELYESLSEYSSDVRLQLRPNKEHAKRRGKLIRWRVRRDWQLAFIERVRFSEDRDVLGWLTIKVSLGTESPGLKDQHGKALRRDRLYFMVYIRDNDERKASKRIGKLIPQLDQEDDQLFAGDGIVNPVHYVENSKNRVMLYAEHLEHSWNGPGKQERLSKIWDDLVALESLLPEHWGVDLNQ